MKLTLSCEFEKTALGDLGVQRLRFFLNGQSQLTFNLYQLIFNSVIGIGIAPRNGKGHCHFLQPRHIKAVGFESEQEVVPYQKSAFSGFRLLVEHFLIPEKFLFFELSDIKPEWLGQCHEVDIYFYFENGDDFLPKQLTADNILLGCTPIINLFEQELEPIALKPAYDEYMLLLDMMMPIFLR